MKKLLSILIMLLLAYATQACARDDLMKGPWQSVAENRVTYREPQQASGPGAFLVRLYRDYISPIDGSHCPMYPCCSRYSIECFEKHGFFLGLIMTWDRLLRCGRDELRLSPAIIVSGEQKCYDPVENNDFWWYREK